MRLITVSLLATLALATGSSGLASCDTASDTAASSATGSTSGTGASAGNATTGGAGGTGGSGGLGGGGAGGSGAGGSGAGGAGGFDSCGIGLPPGSGGVGGGAGGPVRVVAANLTSGNDQSYDLGHGVRILQGLDADVILLQEMNFGNNSTTAVGALVDGICDGECRYRRGPDAEIPNGVLSRLPILQCGSWPDPEVQNRTFVWARIDVPGSADLWAISVHLLSSSANARASEVSSLLSHIAGNIPVGDFIVIGGDLNTNSRTEAAVTSLASMFDTGSPYPADQNGNNNTNAPRSKPYDWVLADSTLAADEVPVVIGGSVYPTGAVIDTRVYTPLSEIAPAQSGDSGAPSMQHMAVVKDFQIE